MSDRPRQRGTIPGSKKPNAIRVDVERRRRFVLDMLVAGATYQQVADAVKEKGYAPRRFGTALPDPNYTPRYTKADAYNDGQAAMRKITEQPATELKAIMLRRLGQAQQRMMADLANEDDPADRARAVSALVRAMERQAKLLGLDAPVRSELEISVHFDALAAIANAAVAAGAEAAGLSVDQREAMVDGMQRYLAGVEAKQHRPAAITGTVIDLDVAEGS